MAILKTAPPRLGITVTGTVPYSGWSNPRLVEYLNIVPPSDGIYSFDFVADAPTGVSLPTVYPIMTSYVWSGNLTDIKGVRIHASLNTKEKMLDSEKIIGF